MDDLAWGALALTLTLLGGIYSWFAFRRRGAASGLRASSLALVPLALFLTGTLELVGDIVGDVVDWAARLVFSPTVWLGVIVAAVAVVLYVVSGFLRARAPGSSPSAKSRGEATPKEALPSARSPRSQRVVDEDPEMAEIEALLRKRGIS